MTRGSAQKIEIGTSTIFRILIILLGLWFLYMAWNVVMMLFAAVIVASALGPLADRLGKYKIPRTLTVIGVYLLVLLVGLSVVGLMIQPLSQQVQQLALALPGVVDSLLSFVPTVQVDQTEVVAAFQDGLSQFANDIANLGRNVFAGTRTVIGGFFTVLFVFVIALYLVVEKDALKKFARLVTPNEHRAYVDQAVRRVERGLGRWLLGQLVLGLVVGLIIGLGLQFMGVPYALLLGILAGLMEFIPVIGPVIAAIPAIIVALAQSFVLGIIVLVFYVIVTQIESHVLIPNIMKRAVGLRPLFTIIAVLLGVRLGGVVGIIFAVPVATVINTIASDIFKKE